MKKLIAIAALLLSALQAGASSTLPIEGSFFNASNPHIMYMGRVCFATEGVASFNYPGTTITTGFEGTSLKAVCRPKTGYFMAQIDNAAPFKVAFNAERDSVVTLATALNNGPHTVRMMYIIEGLFRTPEFRGFVLDKGCQLSNPKPLSERRIEFIGNSITCGYGVESTAFHDPYEDETENHMLTYANIVSDSLQAQHTSISRSGIGAYRNYNGPSNGSPDNMNYQYGFTLFNHPEYGQWNFANYQPQLVCINLGTNDFSTPGYKVPLFEQGYRKLLATVREKYPDAKIVLMSGPMLEENENNLVKTAINKICKDYNRHGDKRIYRFDFTPQTGSLGYGASGHPSKLQHEAMAAELLPFLRQIMNW